MRLLREVRPPLGPGASSSLFRRAGTPTGDKTVRGCEAEATSAGQVCEVRSDILGCQQQAETL